MIRDDILENVNAPGTLTTMNLAGPPVGTSRRSFIPAFASGSEVFYFIDDDTIMEWGYGIVTSGSPNTLTRATVIGNTAGTTARLNFSGAARVYNEIPASRSLYINSAGLISPSNLQFAGTPTFNLTGSQAVRLYDSAAGADAKYTDMQVAGGTFTARFVNDAYTNSNNFFQAVRTGYAVTSVSIAGASIFLQGATIITGHTTFNLTGGSSIRYYDSAGGADAKWTDSSVDGGTFVSRFINDALNNANNFFVAVRSGYTITSVTLNGAAINLNGATTITGQTTFNLTGGQYVRYYDSAGATDEKYVTMTGVGTTFAARFANDAFTSANPFFEAVRSGYTVASVTLTAAFISLAGPTSVTGTLNISGNCFANSFIPTSDGRVKTEARLITQAEGELWARSVPARIYRKMGEWEAGFFAQDIEAAGFDEVLVLTDEADMPAEMNGSTGPIGKRWGVRSGTAEAYLSAALLSALEKIDDLTARVAALESA